MQYFLAFLYSMATACSLLFSWSTVLLLLRRWLRTLDRVMEIVHICWKITKWPAVIGIYCQPVIMIALAGRLDLRDIAIFGLNLFGWYCCKDAGDDDFWRKLKSKLKEKIKQVRAKLVVVPEAA
jgi:hypothetical protein